jgi:hypothetical protein
MADLIAITVKPGESPDPPPWDYDEWGLDPDGGIHHQLYGLWWSKKENATLTDIHLQCFLHAHPPEEGGLGKWGHLRESVDLLWNSGEKKHVEWNPWLEEMLEECCENEYLGVAGASSTSKSFGGAVWVWVNFLCAPEITLGLVTSTSLGAAKKRIWKSITQLYNGMPKHYRDGVKHMPSMNQFRYLPRDGTAASDSCAICLIAAEQKQEATAVAKLVGLKNERVFLVADELCEISHSVVAATDNLMSNPVFHMVAMSNPKDREDAFGVFMEPVDGWNSIDEGSFRWKTKLGLAIRFDVLQSPNYLERENIYKYMLTYEKVERARQLKGENSAQFYRFFRGFFPIQGQEDVIYTETDFRAYLKDAVEWHDKGNPIKVAACDPSFSGGGDRTVLMIGLFGRDKTGTWCLQYEKSHALKEDATHKLVPRTDQIATQIKQILDAEKIEYRNFAVDNTGAGRPFCDRLSQILSRDILRVDFSGAASEKPVTANDRTPASKKYVNRVSELWYVAYEFLRGGQVAGIGKSPVLMKELKARRYETVKGGDGERVKVESKIDMRKRTGYSPDEADALAIMVELCRDRYHWQSVERGFSVLPETDYIDTLKSLDIVTLSNQGQPEWIPMTA